MMQLKLASLVFTLAILGRTLASPTSKEDTPERRLLITRACPARCMIACPDCCVNINCSDLCCVSTARYSGWNCSFRTDWLIYIVTALGPLEPDVGQMKENDTYYLNLNGRLQVRVSVYLNVCFYYIAVPTNLASFDQVRYEHDIPPFASGYSYF
jgi:hypothetical protein